jgi:hypothetical protein
MRPWIAVAYSAPVAAATAVFLIYPIGQASIEVNSQHRFACLCVSLELSPWLLRSNSADYAFDRILSCGRIISLDPDLSAAGKLYQSGARLAMRTLLRHRW